jgi:hypothetical protein
MTKILFLVILFASSTLVSGAMAIQKPAPDPASTATGKPTKEKMEKFSGVIEKVDEMGKVIFVKGKMRKEERTLTFAVHEKTKITQHKMTITFRDLKKDMQVFIEYKKEMNKMIAVAIEASAPKAPPRKM